MPICIPTGFHEFQKLLEIGKFWPGEVGVSHGYPNKASKELVGGGGAC